MLSILALGSSLAWGGADFVAGLTSRRLPALAVVGWSQALALVILSIVAATRLGTVSGTAWLGWAVAGGIAGLVGLGSFYTALAQGTMGVVAPISGLGVLVPVIAGIARGEQPSSLAWVGMVLAIAGVVLASGPELNGAVSARPVALAVVAAFGFGATLLFIERGAQHSLLFTLWGMRLTSVVLLVIVALALRSTGGARWSDLPVLLLIGSGDLLANALYGVASSRGEVSIAAVLGSLYPVVTVLLARVVLGERLARIQKIGVAMAIGGAALVAV